MAALPPARARGSHAIKFPCRLGRREEAYEQFREWEGFFLPPFDVARECLSNEGTVFLTGIGGFLQNLLYGFAGIRVDDGLSEEGLTVQPALPEAIPRIVFPKLSCKGRLYRLSVEKRHGRDGHRLSPLA